MLARGPVVALASESAWLAAMVEVEVALAYAAARVGLIPAEHAESIGRACRGLTVDVAAITEEAGLSGTPVLPLVHRIRAVVDPPAADSVHPGATSQDILDTATMLVASRSLAVIDEGLRAASGAAARLARAHRGTPIAGRTLLQQALPTTFGLKAAGWMMGLDRAANDLTEVRATQLSVQLGGAAGTLASFRGEGRRVAQELAGQLGLRPAILPWHTERSRMGRLAGTLGIAAGVLMKPARDVILLSQSEVGEVSEGVSGRGASSALPHKRNPIARGLGRRERAAGRQPGRHPARCDGA